MKRSLILSGWTALLSLALPVSAQDLYTFQGETDTQLGFSVRSAGDVNGDGVGDLICGRPHWQITVGGSDGAGAEVFSGLDGTTLLLITFPGPAGSGLGFSVDGVGDVNGDGHDDVVLGAPHDDSNGPLSGSARVYSGADGTQLHAVFGIPDSFFGGSVAGIGDSNGDGVPDFAVGAAADSTGATNAGRFQVFSGVDGSLLLTVDGNEPNSGFGRISAVGDLNADGRSDILCGAPWSSVHGPTFGFARVYSGADGSLLLDVPGYATSKFFGASLAGVGDVNGDSVPDLVVGAPGSATNSRGEARVFSGANGSMIHRFRGDGPADRLGWSVGNAQDVNGDGVSDIIAGGFSAGYVAEWGGIARVFSGSDGAELFQWHGQDAFDMFGFSVCGPGDLNGDGLAELAVGASGANSYDGYVRVLSAVTPGISSYCFADGTTISCPCGNVDPSAGCANSTGAGARLDSAGSRSLSAADLVLNTTGLPAGVISLVFFGSTQVSVPFGDGTRCVGGGIRRIGIGAADGTGAFSIAVGQGAPAQAIPGTTDYAQIWYRDPLGPCGMLFNVSSALEIPWLL